MPSRFDPWMGLPYGGRDHHAWPQWWREGRLVALCTYTGWEGIPYHTPGMVVKAVPKDRWVWAIRWVGGRTWYDPSRVQLDHIRLDEEVST